MLEVKEPKQEPKLVKVCDWCQRQIPNDEEAYDYGLPYHRDCLDRKYDVQTKNADPYEDESEL